MIREKSVQVPHETLTVDPEFYFFFHEAFERPLKDPKDLGYNLRL
jgi:hypothetical protein